MEHTVRAAGGADQAKESDAEPRQNGHGPPDVPQWVYRMSDAIYRSLPRTGDMNDLTAQCIGRGLLSETDQKRMAKADRPPWWETVGVAAAFIAVMLGLASWRFARADY